MHPSLEGGVWLGTGRGLAHHAGESWRAYDLDVEGPVYAIHQQRSGEIWLGMEGAVIKLAGEEQTEFSSAEGVPAGPIVALMVSRSGQTGLGQRTV